MKNFIIYDKNSEQIAARIQAASESAICNPYSSHQYERIEITGEMNPSDASLDENLNVIEDQDLKNARIQQERNAKLQQLRDLRAVELDKADVMVNELTLAIRSDLQAVKDHRQALLDFTNPYKDVNGDANSDIDSLDLSNIAWPQEPEPA